MEDNKPAKQEHHNQDLTPSKGGEWGVADALQSRQIRFCSDEDIKEKLRLAMLMSGIRAHNMPVDEEKQVLINWIRQEYGTHRIEEIRVAFESAYAGQLELADVKCYENFSCEYFGRIFHAYREWALMKVKGFKPVTIISDVLDSLPRGEEDWTDEWENLIENFDPDNAFYEWTPWTCFYDWLKRNGNIEINEELVNQARVEELAILQRKYPQTPQDKAEIERLKCIDWRKDRKVQRYISTRVKTIHVKQLLLKLQNEKNENTNGCENGDKQSS